MAVKQQSNNRSIDAMKWFLAIAIIVVGLVANYYVLNIATPIRIIAWIIIAALALYVASRTNKGKYAVKFASEARMEMRKVVWPNRQETTQTTIVVLIIVVISGLFLWLVDVGFITLIGWLTAH